MKQMFSMAKELSINKFVILGTTTFGADIYFRDGKLYERDNHIHYGAFSKLTDDCFEGNIIDVSKDKDLKNFFETYKKSTWPLSTENSKRENDKILKAKEIVKNEKKKYLYIDVNEEYYAVKYAIQLSDKGIELLKNESNKRYNKEKASTPKELEYEMHKDRWKKREQIKAKQASVQDVDMYKLLDRFVSHLIREDEIRFSNGRALKHPKILKSPFIEDLEKYIGKEVDVSKVRNDILKLLSDYVETLKDS